MITLQLSAVPLLRTFASAKDAIQSAEESQPVDLAAGGGVVKCVTWSLEAMLVEFEDQLEPLVVVAGARGAVARRSVADVDMLPRTVVTLDIDGRPSRLWHPAAIADDLVGRSILRVFPSPPCIYLYFNGVIILCMPYRLRNSSGYALIWEATQ